MAAQEVVSIAHSRDHSPLNPGLAPSSPPHPHPRAVPAQGRGCTYPVGAEDACGHLLTAYVLDVLGAVPQHAKSRCPGYWSEGRAVARGDRRLLTGQQLAQEIKV